MEAPWGMAQLTFFADRKRVPKPAAQHGRDAGVRQSQSRIVSPTRVLPDFMGTTFLKQALVELNADRSALYKPVTQEAMVKASTPLWAYLDALHPHLWRAGKQFPQNSAAVRQMMSDGELLIALTFNPNEAANEIAAKRLTDSVYSYQVQTSGTLGNTHFLAIPFNAKAKEGAQVVGQLSALARGAGPQGRHRAVGRPHRAGRGQTACRRARPFRRRSAARPGGAGHAHHP